MSPESPPSFNSGRDIPLNCAILPLSDRGFNVKAYGSRGCAASPEVLSAARALKRVPLGVIRRHFLLNGDQHGVGGLRTVELLVRHPVQLLRREVHVLMDVLVLLGGRQARCFINNSSAFSLSAHRAGTPDCCDNGTRKPRAGGSELRRMLGGGEAVGRDVMS